MILGVGTDLVHLPRIARALAQFGDRFAQRILDDEEFTEYQRRASESAAGQTRAVRFAGSRFAAKEAAAKALRTGFRDGITLRNFAVRNGEGGAPTLVVSGAAAHHAAAMGATAWHLSLSEDGEYAQAFVVLSGAPETS